MKNISIMLVGVLLGLGILGIMGCSYVSGSEAEAGSAIDFEVVDPYEADSEIGDWYEELKEIKGVHRLDKGDYTYILVSEGEKPSGGYDLEINSATASNDTIKVEAVFTSPQPDAMTITIITYPSELIRIKQDTRDVELVMEEK